ncbi:unnamed protein product [Chilo suppressalis]|uniref:Uncharacterized protein n=2 Tax=Chilo suppressalis TaxID=168631 RepID=A0ABN8AUX8_CHISP|nr:hypothetical protein evm_006485 [Chilo suppressalis]CAH0399877.1 unnamed protein product [Chilo suppressalis]
MYQKIFIFCLLNFIYLGSSSSVPYVTKCKADDAACIKSSAQAMVTKFVDGIPELGVEKMDPMNLKKPIDASSPGLKVILKDLVVTGLRDCNIQSMSRDAAKNKLFAKILCDAVNTVGQYEMDGKLIVLQVSGKGKITTVLKKILMSVEADMGEKKGKDGKTHWDIKRFTHSFELQDKSELEFENLFTGSEVLGKAANQVIESSSNEIILEIGPPVVKAIATKVVENTKRFFNNVDPADLALD